MIQQIPLKNVLIIRIIRKLNKRIAIFLFLLLPVVLTAQKAKPKNDSNYDERLLHFGFSMGTNTMDFILRWPVNQASLPRWYRSNPD